MLPAAELSLEQLKRTNKYWIILPIVAVLASTATFSLDYLFNSMQRCLFLFLLLLTSCASNLRIGLHAQLRPEEKIVGSVITTQGLASAFLKRNDVESVDIFYPYFYASLNKSYDLIIIEGWFPLIHDFISMARTYGSPIILYYCLDPVFPGMDVVYRLDVDGYLTNSKELVATIADHTFAPAAFVMLAADPDIMKPISPPATRPYGAVYIGAGGDMLIYKPHLLPMLMEALPYNLLLYGSHWEQTSLRATAKGPLPHSTSNSSISIAYSQADVILAATIESQLEKGMINNRLFEAAAVGVVVSDYSSAIYEIFGDTILYANTSRSVAEHIDNIQRNATYRTELFTKSRQLILSHHTYQHRVIEILSFYHKIRAVTAISRHAQPKAAVVIDNALLSHGDYQYALSQLLTQLRSQYIITAFNNADAIGVLSWNSSLQESFEVIVVISTPATLPNLRSEPLLLLPKNIYQKRLCYLFPADTAVTRQVSSLCDIVMYRDSFDYNLLQLQQMPQHRVQHVFGIGGETNGIAASTGTVVVCFAMYSSECSSSNRKNFVSNSDITALLLLGESLDFWLESSSNPVVDFDILSKVWHTSSYSSSAVQTIAKATKVYLMYGSASSSSIEIWPFVVAAVHNVSITIATANPKILAIAAAGVSDWDRQYGSSGTSMAIRRLHAFPSSSARLNVDASVANASTVPADAVLYFVPSFVYYSAGRDGETCIYSGNTSLMCIIRDHSYFKVVFNSTRSSGSNTTSNIPIEISIRMKGSFYADDVDSIYFSYSICLDNCATHSDTSVSEKPQLQNEITVVIDV